MQEKTPYWQRYIEGAAIALRSAIGTHDERGGFRYDPQNYSQRAIDALRALLPYCLHPVGPNCDTLIWLNRDYKPLGIMPYSDRVDYQDFPLLHVSAKDPKICGLLEQLKTVPGYVGSPPIHYFYNDHITPRAGKKYAQRLLGLLEMVVKKSP